MTLQQLRYIVTIVNCGSISEAAKQLFITQPSLSNAVKELEKEMGISIFNRSSKGIAPVSYTHLDVYKRQAVTSSVTVLGISSTLSKSPPSASITSLMVAFSTGRSQVCLLYTSRCV